MRTVKARDLITENQELLDCVQEAINQETDELDDMDRALLEVAERANTVLGDLYEQAITVAMMTRFLKSWMLPIPSDLKKPEYQELKVKLGEWLLQNKYTPQILLTAMAIYTNRKKAKKSPEKPR